MKTSVIGYPRIGSLRELKFAAEKYFRNVISAEALLETAENIRRENWDIQKKNGVKTKPVIIGAFTFLKLARFTGKKNISDFADAVLSAYRAYLKRFGELGAE